MKGKNFSVVWITLLLPLVLGTGCKQGSRKAPERIDLENAGEIAARIETMKQVYHLCPSPAEMLGVINVGELQFDAGLLNPAENEERYLDTRARTMALGFYITDLAYAALFGRQEETLVYLEIVGRMAQQIHVTGAISEELLQKARDNVGYLDSLFTISNEAFVNLMVFCEQNDRPGTMIMISAGAFIESLYLAIGLVEDYESAGYILTHIADQKYAIENMMVYAEKLAPGDENISALMEDMGPIRSIYDGIETGGDSIRVRTERKAEGDVPGKLLVAAGGESPAGLSREEFERLKEETVKLRSGLSGE